MFSKTINIAISLLLFTISASSSISYATSDNYVPQKIVIGTYNKVTGRPGSNNVPWTYVKTSHVAIDDHRIIYVLDRQGKRVLLFSEKGALLREISLFGVDFADKSEELGDEGYIEYQMEVSSDGKYIYVTEGGKENNWAVIDNSGKPIKKNISLKRLHRRCDDRLMADADAIEVDEKLNVIKKLNIKEKKQQVRIVDLQDNVYYLNLANNSSDNATVLTKFNVNGKQIFRKEIPNASKPFGFVGVDGNNNVYIMVDEPRKMVKVSSEGMVQAEIAFPNDSFFKGCGKCKALCDGTIYCIPDYSSLWQANKGKTIFGEYSIYFFEKK